jgi:hypothetical protein
MRRSALRLLPLLGLATMASRPAAPLPVQVVDTPLSALERLVGGSWYIGEDSYQVFSWGVGRQSVKAEMYFISPEGEKLVSEATYFYHPGRETLLGFGVAVDMGIDVFEYTSIQARGDTLILDLSAFGPQATDGVLRETWTFLDEDRYEWVLWARVEDGTWAKQMDGIFERRWGSRPGSEEE